MAEINSLLAEANSLVPKIGVPEAQRLVKDEEALVVDVREANELAASGKLKGALHVPRGMIEFSADPDAPNHNPEFRKNRPVILYCAAGVRASLAGKALRDLGYERTYNLGGFKYAAEGGFETEPA
jgi:rhodanese-related sulfurtransferase